MAETNLLTDVTDAKIQEVRDLLEEAGEDLRDFPTKRIIRMIKEGFLDD